MSTGRATASGRKLAMMLAFALTARESGVESAYGEGTGRIRIRLRQRIRSPLHGVGE